MAFNTKDTDEAAEIADINVTPFIDVMLVLLIIFMIAAPLSTVDVKVDLPASSSEEQVQKPNNPLNLTLQLDSKLYLENDLVDTASLAAKLDEITKGDKDQVIFLRADKEVKYQNLLDLMNDLRKANYLQVALVGLE